MEGFGAAFAGLEVFLFDCDGVLFRGSAAIPGAVETLQRLAELGKRCYFVTNNATKSREDNAIKLRSGREDAKGRGGEGEGEGEEAWVFLFLCCLDVCWGKDSRCYALCRGFGIAATAEQVRG